MRNIEIPGHRTLSEFDQSDGHKIAFGAVQRLLVLAAKQVA